MEKKRHLKSRTHSKVVCQFGFLQIVSTIFTLKPNHSELIQPENKKWCVVRVLGIEENTKASYGVPVLNPNERVNSEQGELS